MSDRNCDGGREREGGVEEVACLLVTLDMAALRIWVRVGLIPHAKHGGRGVCAFAIVGSKFEGTGFGKLQIVQTQVALLACVGVADEERIPASTAGEGDAPVLPLGPEEAAVALDWREPRLVGFGKSVTFGEDFRNPAYVGFGQT